MPGKGTSSYWDTCNNRATRFLAGLVDQGVVFQGADSDGMESGSKMLTQTTRGNTLQRGGGGLDIVGQILVTLQSGSHRHTTVVLVQKQAPEALLLGTDLQPYLRFWL